MSSHSNYLLVAEPGDRDRRPTCGGGVVTAAECECEGDPPPLQTQSTLTISRSTHNPQHSTGRLTTHTLLAACCSGMKIQNFHIRKLFLGVPGTSTTTGLWSPPSPGSLNHNPSWQHSAGPGHSSMVSHHPTITTSQPLASAHVQTKPSVLVLASPGCGEQQQPTKTIIPWLPPHRRP